MYYREVKGYKGPVAISDMLMLTKSDGEYAADFLNHQCDPKKTRYRSSCNFCGYEGYDAGVFEDQFVDDGWDYGWKFKDRVDCKILEELCKDRPIVPQSESWN